ncbi:tail fiber domain-containing protein [Hymenobacter rubidus]|uniref:tail fiber domain-containing protein n=1 Tax=Hymenobacter rubidus TaxID=1441626 RepID=UPI00191D9521|nr:tail fiber domain-containing protein [Hymenobacter rubidus]
MFRFLMQHLSIISAPLRRGAGRGLMLLAGLLLAAPLAAQAQTGGVRIGTPGTPDVSAALDIVSSSKGALLPRVADATAIASPAKGLIVYQTGGTAGFYYNAGTPATPNWQQLATAAGAAVTASNGLTKTGPDVRLGGTLTQATTVDQAGNSFKLTNTGSSTSVDQQQLTSGPVTGDADMWQSFTAGISGLLTQLDLYVSSPNGANGAPGTLSVYAGEGTGGALLTTQAITFNNVYGVFQPFVLTTPVAVVAGQQYTYRLQTSAAVTHLFVAFASNDPYAGGRNNVAATWDLAFKTYVATPITLPVLTALPGGNVGVGTSTPGQKLEVNGQVFSSAGGFRFPDNSVQTTAAFDAQQLSISGATISLTNGGTVAVPADNLGNHTATQNLNLGTNLLVGNGGSSGVAVSSSGSVGIGTTPAASAALEVSSTTKGLLPPRLSTAQRNAIASPATGLVVYNTTTNRLNTWNGTSWDAALAATEQPYQNPSQAFAYTGTVQTYTVPEGVTSLRVDAVGASGGGLDFSGTLQRGGIGARVQATLQVTPGQVLQIRVGGAGAFSNTVSGAAGGYNGGGSVATNGGSGGGATDVRVSGGALTDRLLVAGGGGGGGYSPNYSEGGAGGQPNGGNGTATFNTGPTTVSATGGTQTAGGNSGGSLGQGGGTSTFSGGGGGGGYYGGGGSYSGGGAGGGGSSWVTPTGSSSIVMLTGNSINGSLTITPAPVYATPVLDGRNFVNVPGTWSVSGPNVYRSTGSVGIGTSAPTQALEVAGQVFSNTGGFRFPDNTVQTTAAVTTPATTASNGLTLTGQSVGLGGTLSQATTITQAGNNFSLTGGNVGVGTTSPVTTLDVRTADASAAVTVGQTDNTAGAVYFGNPSHGVKRNYSNGNDVGLYTTAANLYLSANGTSTSQFVLLNNGNVGIGTTPGAKLHVAGNMKIDGANTLEFGAGISGKEVSAGKIGYGTFSNGSSLDIVGAGTGSNRVVRVFAENGLGVNGAVNAQAFNTNSDARFKTHVRPIGAALASVLALRGVRYDWNALGIRRGGKAGAGQVGVIAQELEKVYPELVSTGADGYKAVNYAQLTPVLIEALKEQQAQIEALKQQNTALRAETTATTEAFEARLRALEAATSPAHASR